MDVKRDITYQRAVDSGDTQTAQALVDQAAREAGYDTPVFHGTPNGGFTEFRGWSFFTGDRAYADRYQNPSASGTRGHYEEANNPQTYSLYLRQGNVFDTRDPETAELLQAIRDGAAEIYLGREFILY